MRTNSRSRLRRALLAVGLAALLAGCAASPAVLPGEPLPAAFENGVPAPTGEVVLTVTTPDAEHDWDLATLGRLPQHDLTIFEPFIEEEHTYTGPMWADVLRASGVDLEEAGTAEVLALDDYVADVPVEAEALDGLLLAREQDGDDIPLAEGGPIRLVFPPDNPAGENLNHWVWSVRSATIE